jgi:hypothetical protein
MKLDSSTGYSQRRNGPEVIFKVSNFFQYDSHMPTHLEGDGETLEKFPLIRRNLKNSNRDIYL